METIQKTISLRPAIYSFDGLNRVICFGDNTAAKPNTVDGDCMTYRDAVDAFRFLVKMINTSDVLYSRCEGEWIPVKEGSNLDWFLLPDSGVTKVVSATASSYSMSEILMLVKTEDYSRFNGLFNDVPNAVAFLLFIEEWLSSYVSYNVYLNDYSLGSNNETYLDRFKSKPFIDNGGYVIRYRTMVDNFTWIREFIHNCRVYEYACKDNCINEEIWMELTFDDVANSATTCSGCAYKEYDPKMILLNASGTSVTIANEIPSGQTVGAIVYIADNLEEYADKFDSNVTNLLKFYCLAASYLYPEDGGSIDNTTNYGVTTAYTQYIDFPVVLNEECDELGNYNTVFKQFDKRRRYYNGDMVIFTNDSGETSLYIADTSNSPHYAVCEITDTLYDTISASLSALPHNMSVSVDKKDGQSYLEIPYIIGIVPESNEEPPYWKKVDDQTVIPEKTNDIIGYIKGGYVKSMMRYERSFDDNGTLPYYINEKGDKEILYKIGEIHNQFRGSDGCFYGDVITSTATTEMTDGSKWVTLAYQKGCTINETTGETTDVISVSGVSFTETYRLIEKETSGGIPYYDLDYSTTLEHPEGYPEGCYAKFIISGVTTVLDYFDEDNYGKIHSGETNTALTRYMKNIGIEGVIKFRNPALMGYIDISEESNGRMDRGMSGAAFERHQILTEINTMEDLENYRNNMFNV